MVKVKYKCGMYCRLSDADNNTDESSSITSQKMIIESFANFNNLNIVKTYVDDGFSGGNFDRPAFKEMISDIEKGLINCVITKDLSRLGREMYGTGRYIEQYFLEHKVRYIAINDSFDSNIGDSMLGLRLSVNDLYLRDVSKKVRTSLKMKQERGDYIGSIPLYGYKKNPDDKHKLIIDEEVRDNVELIYELALEGKSPRKIAEILTIRKVPIPIVHKKENRGKNIKENDGCGIWKRQTVYGILTNQMYIGNMVQNTYIKISYNSKKLKKTTPDEYIIVENTHEAIIDKDVFFKVQEILSSRKQEPRESTQDKYLLSSLLYCKECGRRIGIHEKIRKSKISHFTQCNLYTRKGKFGSCSSHIINYDWLEEDILEYLKETCKKFIDKYGIEELEEKSEKEIRETVESLTKKIDKIESIIENNKNTIDNLYLDKVNGVISIDMFKRLLDKHNKELTKNNNEIEVLRNKKNIYENKFEKNSDFYRSKKIVLDFLAMKNINKDLILKLINRIEIDSNKNIYVYLSYKNLSTLCTSN